MPRDPGPYACIGWMKAHGTPDGLAGAAFLIGPTIALTCAHVVREHLGLGHPTPFERPDASLTIRLDALGSEISGRVMKGGWFPDSRQSADGLSDIAVIRLDAAVTAISTPAIARQMPNDRRNTCVFGAEAGYQSIGQFVDAIIGANANNRGWRQLDPTSGATGFTVERGFSGAPALDDLGNTVWGMIVAVDAQDRKVAFAVTADDLRMALREAGVVADIRVSDDLDAISRAAMDKMRHQYEAKIAETSTQSKREREELERLREAVRGLEQTARQAPADTTARDALSALTQGDPKPAADVLRERISLQKRAGRAAYADAATASRQLGAVLSLTDSNAALAAYRDAAELDPDDAWTLIEVGQLEQRAGTLSRAADALTQALSASNSADERTRGAAWTDLGDVRVAQGDLAAGLEAFRKGLDIRTRLAAGDPHNSHGSAISPSAMTGSAASGSPRAISPPGWRRSGRASTFAAALRISIQATLDGRTI